MKKKIIIIISAVMAVAAIGLGVAIGFNFKLKRNVKYDSIRFISYYSGDLETEIERYDSMKEFKVPDGVLYRYDKKFFVTKSVISLKVDGPNDRSVYMIKQVERDGKKINIIVKRIESIFNIKGGNYFYIEVNKWDLLGVKEIGVIIEEE